MTAASANTKECSLNCSKWYRTSSRKPFHLACSSQTELLEPPMLYIDTPDSLVKLTSGDTHDGVYFNATSSSVFVSLANPSPQHFGSYSIAGLTCKGSNQSFSQEFALVEDIGGKKSFSPLDYAIFGIFLTISLTIGVGLAAWVYVKRRRAHREATTTDFLLASRSMHVMPLTLSLLSTFMSAITLIGTSSEIYTFGCQYLVSAFSCFFFVPIGAHCFMPFFYNLGVTSVYEYLEKRFSIVVRRAAAFVYLIHMTLFMAMVVYTPSIAMQAVTGLNMWFSALISAGICIVYTSLGGLRSAVWTDVFQVSLMTAGLLAVLIQGSYREGGLFNRAWELAKKGGRDHFLDFRVNPLLRHSFWALVVGGTFTWSFEYCVSQSLVQRALSARTLKEAQLVYWLTLPGLLFFMILSGICGIIVYARYAFCDPILEGRIAKRDQLLPLYVMEVLSEDLPGFPGLFLAMMFSGSLSTLSSGLNGLGAVAVTDFAQVLCFDRLKLGETARAHCTRLFTLAFGVATILLIIFVEKVPGILEMSLALFSALGGPVFGLFTTGMYIPFVKWQSVFVALIISLSFNIWMVLGNVLTGPRNYSTLRTSVEACSDLANQTSLVVDAMPANIPEMDEWSKFYSVSYMYYSIIGAGGTIIIALLLTPIFGCTDLSKLRPGFSHAKTVEWTRRVQRKLGVAKSRRNNAETDSTEVDGFLKKLGAKSNKESVAVVKSLENNDTTC